MMYTIQRAILLIFMGGMVPSEGRFINLITAKIENEKLEKIPTTFDKNLHILEISNSEIDSLDNLSTYKHLQILTIQESQIFMFNETVDKIFQLTNLRELNLNGNSLKAFDLGKLKRLRNLKRFSLANNPGIRIYGSGAWSKLTHLNLRDNYLRDLDSIRDLFYLEELIVDGNSLETIPTYFTKFAHLKLICASNNPLRYIPDELRTKVQGNLVDKETSTLIPNLTENDSNKNTTVTLYITAILLVVLLMGLVILLGGCFFCVIYRRRNSSMQ